MGAAVVVSLAILGAVVLLVLRGESEREVLCRSLVQAEVDSAQALVIAVQRNALRDGRSEASVARIGRAGARYVVDVRAKVAAGLEPIGCDPGPIEPAPPVPPVRPEPAP